jgi:hypothetical protein
MQDFFVNILLPLGSYLIPVTLGLMVLGMVLGMLRNPKGAVKSLAGLGVIVVVFIIAYSSADPTNYSSVPASEGVVKLVEAGLVTLVVVLGLTLIAVVGSGIKNLVK